jgi:hypothetical protein
MIYDKKENRARPCGNRVISFVVDQPDDECYACHKRDDMKFDPGSGWTDRNNGGVPK